MSSPGRRIRVRAATAAQRRFRSAKATSVKRPAARALTRSGHLFEVPPREDEHSRQEKRGDIQGSVAGHERKVAGRHRLPMDHLGPDVVGSQVGQDPIERLRQKTGQGSVHDLLEVAEVGAEPARDEQTKGEGRRQNRGRR